jgi:hypothetical protein
MAFQGAAPGLPFEMRLEGCFPQLTKLIVINEEGGSDVALTLGDSPKLKFLHIRNFGMGGWVVPLSPLPQLQNMHIG